MHPSLSEQLVLRLLNTMQYLIRKKKSKTAHLWNEEYQDTECRMASTGGLSLKNYEVWNDNHGLKICHMCSESFDAADEVLEVLTDLESDFEFSLRRD